MSTEGRLRHWFSQLLPPKQDPSTHFDTQTSFKYQQRPARKHNGSPVQTSIYRPEPVVSKIGGLHSIEPLSRRPTDAELDSIEWGQSLSGPGKDNIGTSTMREDIESRPASGRASPINVDDTQTIVHMTPSIKHPYMNRWRIMACCIAFFIQGLNDSAPGALLPYMERYYNIRYAMVSLIFVANALGFIIAAPFCHMLNNRFGRAKVLSACTTLNIIAYIALVCQPPFAVVVVAFLFLGK